MNSWDSVGARTLAGDIVLNAAPQVRALRSLSARLARCSEGGSVGSSRADTHLTRREEEHRERRSSLPRRRSHDQASHEEKSSPERWPQTSKVGAIGNFVGGAPQTK